MLEWLSMMHPCEHAASCLLLDIHPAASRDFDDKRDTSGLPNRLNYRLPSRHPGRIGVGPERELLASPVSERVLAGVLNG